MYFFLLAGPVTICQGKYKSELLAQPGQQEKS